MEAERREECKTRLSRPRCRADVEKEVKIVKFSLPAKILNPKVRLKQEAAEKRRLEAQKEKRQKSEKRIQKSNVKKIQFDLRRGKGQSLLSSR